MNKEQMLSHPDYIKSIKNSNNIEDSYLVDIMFECCPDYIDFILDSMDQPIPINKDGKITKLSININMKTFNTHTEVIDFIKDRASTEYFFFFSYLNGVLYYKTLDIYEDVRGLSSLVKYKLRKKSLNSLLD